MEAAIPALRTDNLLPKEGKMPQNLINPDDICRQAVQAKLAVYQAKEQFESILKMYNDQMDNLVNVVTMMKNRILELEQQKTLISSNNNQGEKT